MTNNNIKISIVEYQNYWTDSLVESVYNTRDLQLVSTYSNAEDALQKLWKETPDVIIMSIRLPQMNGIECMMRLRRKIPDIPFLIFTKQEDARFIFTALKGGASGYILKEEGVEAALNGVREIVAGGSPFSRTIAQMIVKSFRPADKLVEKISTRERQILHLLSQGFLNKEIAAQLNPPITEGTVKQHIYRIYRKLKVSNRTEAVNKYLKF